MEGSTVPSFDWKLPPATLLFPATVLLTPRKCRFRDLIKLQFVVPSASAALAALALDTTTPFGRVLVLNKPGAEGHLRVSRKRLNPEGMKKEFKFEEEEEEILTSDVAKQQGHFFVSSETGKAAL
ncbi:hypothetical protein NDU88_004454 [Pleurodeles waltl]|uniref:Uncharacterized protein n=1 Tax=Pleurodeles waltl TaxID=8319 RepID=A0AAV7QHU6_PLEWA|nr:hypothetical protein NDU88_004454 [Pleurodeles waltl]